MQDITLQALLEAGCHFGHKAERWNPKAVEFIYTKKDGVHIIDLAKTKAGLEAACTYIEELVGSGGEVLFVATKRQAKGVVKEAVMKAGAPHLIERWIGGFLTNWDAVRKNIQNINRLTDEQATDAWKKFPKKTGALWEAVLLGAVDGLELGNSFKDIKFAILKILCKTYDNK